MKIGYLMQTDWELVRRVFPDVPEPGVLFYVEEVEALPSEPLPLSVPLSQRMMQERAWGVVRIRWFDQGREEWTWGRAPLRYVRWLLPEGDTVDDYERRAA